MAPVTALQPQPVLAAWDATVTAVVSRRLLLWRPSLEHQAVVPNIQIGNMHNHDIINNCCERSSLL